LSHSQTTHWIFARFYQLVSTTIRIWSETNVSRNSAAMTYYAMLSLAPLLLICIALAGLFFCNQQVEQEIYAYFHEMASPQVAQTIATLLANTTSAQNTLFASLISMAIMLYGASGVFTQLFDTFNDIWGVPQDQRRGIRFTARKRVLGVCMVLMVGTLLIGSLALGAIVAYLSQLLDGSFPRLASWLGLIDRGLSFFLLPFVLSLMFWYLPMKKIRWPDVWPAAGLTAAMLAGSRYLIDIYLRLSTASEVYGAAGSLVLLLVWIYLTGQVIFFGACFSCAWARYLGGGAGPVERVAKSQRVKPGAFPTPSGTGDAFPVVIAPGQRSAAPPEWDCGSQQELAGSPPAILDPIAPTADPEANTPPPTEPPRVQLIRRPKLFYRRSA
jgi:membrane protein